MEKTTSGGTVSGLYSLRTGLSLVAQEKEQIDAVLDVALSHRTVKLNSVKATEDTARKNAEAAKATYDKAKKIEADNLAVANYQPDGRYKKLKTTKIVLGIFVFLFVLALIYVVGYLPLWFGWVKDIKFFDTLYGWVNGYKKTFVFYAIYVAAALLPIILFTVFGIIITKIKKKLKVYNQNFAQKKKARALTKELAVQTKKAEGIYNGQLEIYNKVAGESPAKIAEIEKACKLECAPAVSHAVVAAAVMKALQASYAPLMEEEDWCFLDGTIYAIEMSKATTVSEALEYLAKLQKVDKMDAVIKLAEAHISRAVLGGVVKAKKEYKQSITALALQITRQAQSTAEQSKVSNVSELMAYVGKVTTPAALYNSLTAKSSTPSALINEQTQPLSAGVRYIIDRLKA